MPIETLLRKTRSPTRATSMRRSSPLNASSAAIVQATIQLGHGLGLEVVAEGVEDVATLEALRALHCDRAQGYLFSRALPADEIEAWIAVARS